MALKTGQADLSPENTDFVVAMVDRKLGIQLEGKEFLVASRLQPLVKELGAASADDLVARLKRRDRRIEAAVMDSMTTNETSFFRDLHPFHALANEILPEQLAATDQLAIWNGACSSGQESYTLAMLIHEHHPDRAADVSILSSDVSPAMVQRTEDGVYSRFEMNRGLPANLALKYFDQAGRDWVAKPSLTDMIETRELNLMDPLTSIGRFDIVVLRNVLAYFSTERKKDILGRVRQDVLNPGGCLVLGATETTVGLDPGFESRHLGRSTFFFIKGAS